MKCNQCGKAFRLDDALYCPYCGKKLSTKLRFFSEDEDEFLIRNCMMHRADLASIFNEKFGESKSPSAIAHRCRRLGLTLPKDIRYDRMVEATRKSNKKYEIGDERIYRGFVWVKTSDENAHHPKTVYESKCWARKHYLVWEKAHGKVPKGNVIVFLDGNPMNCNLENLYCTSKENALFTSNPAVFKNECAATRKAGLAWGEAYFALRDSEIKIKEKSL